MKLRFPLPPSRPGRAQALAALLTASLFLYATTAAAADGAPGSKTQQQEIDLLIQQLQALQQQMQQLAQQNQQLIQKQQEIEQQLHGANAAPGTVGAIAPAYNPIPPSGSGPVPPSTPGPAGGDVTSDQAAPVTAF